MTCDYLVGSGRQALNLIARDLRADGIDTLLAPGWNCATMLLGFQLEGFRVRTIPVDATGQLRPDALVSVLQGVDQPVAVLHSLTLGSPTESQLVVVLADARAAGHQIIVDASHAPLDPLPSADYAMASLRKLLPLPDGAWVSGIRPPSLNARAALDEELVAARLEVLRTAVGTPAWLSATARAEDLVDATPTPVPMSEAGQAALAHLDLAHVREQRTAAAIALRRRLMQAHLEIVNPQATAGWVGLRHPHADVLDGRLTARGIVTPMDWSVPGLLVIDAGDDPARAREIADTVIELSGVAQCRGSAGGCQNQG